MSATKTYILGNNNRVDHAVTGLAAINCEGQEFTIEDSGKTILNDRAVEIDTEGILTAKVGVRSVTVIAGSTTTSASRYTWYYCDASGGNITITMVHDNAPKVFKRIDSSINTVELIPESGQIEGAGSKFLVSGEKIEVGSDGTDFWY